MYTISNALTLQLLCHFRNFLTSVCSSFSETYLYDVDSDGECNSDPAAECLTYRGNLFDPSKSSSWKSSDAIQNIRPQDNLTNIGGSNAFAGSDVIALNKSGPGLELVVALPRIYNQAPSHIIGLGNSSRLLSLLYDAQIIASRSWSIFWGQTGLTSDHQSDGALVLGGMDESQATGKSYTGRIQDPTDNCLSGLVVDVTNMEIVFANGSSGSIMNVLGKGQSTNYCILPEQTTTTMFRDQFESWIALDPNAEWSYLGNSEDRVPSGPNGWGMAYPNSRLPEGSLKITIGDGGFSVTIPNHQLVQTYYTIDTSGTIVVNDTHKELMINPLQGEDSYLMPRFAMTLLQAAYLHVNYEDFTFTLWEAANPTGTNSQFVNTGAKASSQPTGCANTTTPDDNSSTVKSSSLSGGAIAGIVIGAIAVIAIIIIGFLLYRRRRRRQAASEQQYPVQEGDYYVGGGGKAELEAKRQESVRRAELEARKNGYWDEQGWRSSGTTAVTDPPRPWLPPQEMPGQRYD